MKPKIIFILMFCLLLSSGANNTSGQLSQQSEEKKLHNQFCQTNGNKLEIITYLEGRGQYENGRLGYSVAGIGDVNLDGYEDVLIGNIDKGPGEAWLLFGAAEMDSLPDLIFCGQNERDGFGCTVAGGGDINGDGSADFFVQAYNYLHGKGRIYIYFGGALLDTIPDLILTGENWWDNFAYCIKAGDVNGDGYDDILASTVNYPGNTNHVFGKAYLYYGGNLLDTIPDWTNQGDSTVTYFGSSLAIGDVNGDEKKDLLIVSSPGGYNPAMTVTEVFLNKTGFDTIPDYRLIYPLYGDMLETLLFCSDFNQDGIDDFLTMYYGYKIYYGSQQFDVEADAYLEPWPYTYIVHFADAGDVNGDGFPDIIGGAPKWIFEGGSVQLYLGSKNINATVDWVAGGRGRMGSAVDGAGDVNGDGYDDIIVSDLILPLSDLSRSIVYILAGNPSLKDYGATDVAESIGNNKPITFKLQQNYPNPFNMQTTIHYELLSHEKQPVQLIIYNLQGEEVIELINELQAKGEYRSVWDGKDNAGQQVSSGVYLGVFTVKQFKQVIKLVLLK